MRSYEVVAVNEKTEAVTVVTNGDPLTHDEACTIAKRFGSHPARRIQLRELTHYERAITGADRKLTRQLIAGLRKSQ